MGLSASQHPQLGVPPNATIDAPASNIKEFQPVRLGEIPGLQRSISISVNSEHILKLEQQTYFDRQELILLYWGFRALSKAAKNYLSKEDFIAAFPQFDSPLVVEALFKGIDRNGDGVIHFDEVAMALSVMSRGTVAEKTKLAFNILDLNGDATVDLYETYAMLKELSRIANTLGLKSTTFGTPESVCENLFKYESTAKLGYWGSLVRKFHLRGSLKEEEKRERSQQAHAQLNKAQEKFKRLRSLLEGYENGQKPVVMTSSLKGVPAAMTSSSSPHAAEQQKRALYMNRVRALLKLPTKSTFFPATDTKSNNDETGGIAALSDVAVRSSESKDKKAEKTKKKESTSSSSKKKKGKKKGPLQLNEKEFFKRAALDPNLYQCFGLFNYMYRATVAQLERPKLISSNAGPLLQLDTTSILRRKMTIERICICKDEFFMMFTVKDFEKMQRKMGASSASALRTMLQRYFPQSQSQLQNANKSHPHLHVLMHLHRVKPLLVVALQHAVVNPAFGADQPVLRLQHPKHQTTFLCKNLEEMQDWVSAIRKNIPLVHRFNAFAPMRENIACKPYINAAPYFWDLADALASARHRILIADWFMATKIYLKRNVSNQEDYRLDHLLSKKAKEGVRIYVLLWDETNMAFALRSGHVKRVLERLDDRIKVIRHPKLKPLSWSHHQKIVCIDSQVAFLGGVDLTWGRYDDHLFRLTDPDEKFWPGKDYGNLVLSHTEVGGDEPLKVVSRKTAPRMPWHDIHVSLSGDAAKDVERNFIQRWNYAIEANHDTLSYEYLLPLSESPSQVMMATSKSTPSVAAAATKSTRKKAAQQTPPATLNAALPSSFSASPAGTCHVQVLRSVAKWSAGVPVAEDSIYKAMIEVISKSEHYIFIENQYFISSLDATEPLPRNKVALAILDRLRRAIREKQTSFRVIVVLPLFPAGNLTDLATRYVLKWVYKTIHFRDQGIIPTLQQEFPGIDISDYISFFHLRNYGFLENRWVTQQVYVHSKLMIVDDRYVLVGSANINDRSLCGDRDSEIAVLIEDTDVVPTRMNGEAYSARRFAYKMRMELWRTLLGEHDAQVLMDPVSNETYGLWKNTAANNTKVYRQVFHHIEDNTTMLQNWRPVCMTKTSQAQDAGAKLANVKGYVVELVVFLSSARLHPHLWEKEFFIGVDTFL